MTPNAWQPIETAPTESGDYLCVTTGCRWWPEEPWAPRIELLHFDSDDWFNDEYVPRTVTHWQPLPPPPETAGREGV